MSILVMDASFEFALLATSCGHELHLLAGPSLSKSLGQQVKNFLQYGPFERLIIGKGPGSFTGIRVIAAMAQSLCFGWNIPLFTVSSLTAFAPEAKSFVIAADARSGGIYIQQNFETPQLLSLEKASLLLESAPLVASPHPSKIVQRLPHLASLNWQERRPSYHPMIQHAEPSQEPLELLYLSHP